MTQYNDIGIDGRLDWVRIRKLLVIGLPVCLFVGGLTVILMSLCG